MVLAEAEVVDTHLVGPDALRDNLPDHLGCPERRAICVDGEVAERVEPEGQFRLFHDRHNTGRCRAVPRAGTRVSSMEILVGLAVVLHLLGMASIAGGWLATYLGAARGLNVLVWGARAQLLIGLLLVGLVQMNKEDLNWAKIAVKLVVALAVVACAEIANARSRKGQAQPVLVNAAFGLMLVNVFVAVLWMTPEA